MDYTTLYASAAISAFGLATLIMGACVVMRQFSYLFVLGLGLLAIGSACVSLYAYRLGGDAWLGMATIIGVMSSFLLIHWAMSQYVGNPDMGLLEWGMVPATSLACVIYALGLDGAAFAFSFATTAILILSTSKLYWDHRHQVPVLLHALTGMGVTTALLFFTRAYVIVAQGQWTIGHAPDNWVENLTAISATLLITSFGPMVVALHHVRDRVALLSEAVTDPLTGLRNRRALLDDYGDVGFTHDMAFIMLDLDHFKKTNDVFGHQVGDDVLRRFAHVVERYVTADVAAFRLGGEEFALIVARGGVQRAMELSARITVAFGTEVVRTQLGPLRSTVSGGVAGGSTDLPDLNEVMAQADAALYEAKRAGRNQVFCHGTAVPEQQSEDALRVA